MLIKLPASVDNYPYLQPASITLKFLGIKLEPFSNFLEVAAQMNGHVLNYTKIARDIGVDTKSVQSYYIAVHNHLDV